MKTKNNKNNLLVSFIIVEYYSVDEVKKCVDFIAQHVTLPTEIIVSSNSCYDEHLQQEVAERVCNVRWVFNERNGGFAYAMNQGLRSASGTHLVIMNSDCIIKEDVSAMVEFMQRHPEVGAIAPQVRDAEGNIQDTARSYVTLPRIIWRQIVRLTCNRGCVLETDMDYHRIQTVDWLIGAFIMVTRKAYELTEGLDESYFMYAEDLDWCTRVRKNGLEVVYYPEITITYKGTRRARHNVKYAKIFLRSHLVYWRRFGFVFGYPKRKVVVYSKG